jgi:hypothetical protein
MPRKSHTELELLRGDGPVVAIKRLRPPPELTEEQREEFTRIVGRTPADWFVPGNMALLTQYCRHVVTARRVDQLIDQALSPEHINVLELATLLKLQQAESHVIHTLLRSLRLTLQAVQPSRESPKRLRLVNMPKPWHDREPVAQGDEAKDEE